MVRVRVRATSVAAVVSAGRGRGADGGSGGCGAGGVLALWMGLEGWEDGRVGCVGGRHGGWVERPQSSLSFFFSFFFNMVRRVVLVHYSQNVYRKHAEPRDRRDAALCM